MVVRGLVRRVVRRVVRGVGSVGSPRSGVSFFNSPSNDLSLSQVKVTVPTTSAFFYFSIFYFFFVNLHLEFE